MKTNTFNDFCGISNKNKKIVKDSNKLECSDKYKLYEINNSNISPIGNNINIDLLTQVQTAQNNLNNELHEIKKIYIPYSSNNKKEMNNQQLFNKEKKINNEENNKRKVINFKNISGKKNYKDIPLTNYFQ